MTEERGRDSGAFRKMGLVSNALQGHDGSSFVCFGKTKVVCTMKGPETCKISDMEHDCLGHVNVVVGGLRSKEENEIIKRSVKNAIWASLFRVKMIKMKLSFDIRVANADGNVLAACINAANIALTNAGVEQFDMAVGTGLALRTDDVSLVDPTKKDEDEGCGVLSVGMLPSLMQVASCEFTGVTTHRKFMSAVERCSDDAEEVRDVVKKALVHDLLQEQKRKAQCVNVTV